MTSETVIDDFIREGLKPETRNKSRLIHLDCQLVLHAVCNNLVVNCEEMP